MKPGDVVVGILPGAVETKVRPAVVIAGGTYIRERPGDRRHSDDPYSFTTRDWDAVRICAGRAVSISASPV